MLKTHSAVATVAVKDLEAARQFYEGKVGLVPSDGQMAGTMAYRTGSSSLFVYVSKFAGTNQATSVTWILGDDLDKTVAALSEKGVVFEHYDLPNMKLQGHIHIGHGLRNAWFKDPDGNIHGLSAAL